MVLTTSTVRPGAVLRIAVHFLSPVSGETVTAELLSDTNVTLVRTKFTIQSPGRPRGRREVSDDQPINGALDRHLMVKRQKRPGKKITYPVATSAGTTTGPTQDIVIDLTAPVNITWGSYTLRVSGKGPIKFKNETSIYGDPRSLAIFVQTDKAAYKPGDTVRFRVFAVNSSLKPANVTLNIEITNPRSDKIFEMMGQSNLTPDGIQGSLPLSDMALLGNYKIEVQDAGVDANSESYSFEVLEYVLPKFEVIVTLPSYGKTSDTELTGKVEAKYTFGKPLVGNVVLQVKERYGGGFFLPSAAQTEFPINGQATFRIPMTVLERVTRRLDFNKLLVVAAVTETATGFMHKGEAEITYYSNPYRIEFFPNMPDNFKHGFGSYPVKIRVTEQDGRPPVTPKDQVKVTTNFFTDKPIQGPAPPNSIVIPNYDVLSPFLLGDTIMIAVMSYPLSNDGTVEFDLSIPANTATFALKAEFGDQTAFKDVSRFRSPNDIFLKIEMGSTSNLKIGDQVTVTFKSNARPSDLNYLVTARKNIVAHGTAQFSSGSFKVTITKEMAPSCRLVAYFVNTNGEIVADGLNFVFEDLFENKVTVAFNQTSVAPKAPVTLKVTADTGSLVNVLAVDKSVILFRQGNDITPQKVTDKMAIFGDFPIILFGWGRIWPWWFSADDASDIFSNAGLTVMTDANLYSFDFSSVQRKGFNEDKSAGSRIGVFSAMTQLNTAAVEPQGQVRTDFPETWLWSSKKAVNGQANFPAIAPDTITDFVANAFAIHPVSGLGVAPVTSNMSVFLPFFVNLQLPYSVIRGELAVIQANVFNYRGNGSTEYASVRLKFSEDYDIVSINGSGIETAQVKDFIKCVKTTQGGVTTVYFFIRPKTIGTIDVNVRADIGPPVNIFDEVVRQLPVKAEGVQREKNQPVLVSLQTSGSVTESRNISFPSAGLVSGSEKIQITVIGDLFGPSLANIDNLIQLPTGTGEATLILFAPAVYAAAYLKETGRFDGNIDLQNKIRTILQTGYQRLLIYQRTDGSFSDFGNADKVGDAWLTIFVLRVLAHAEQLNITTIDSNVIQRAVNFLLNEDPSIADPSTISHPGMNGGSNSSKNAFSAFYLITLNELKASRLIKDQAVSDNITKTITKTTTQLIEQIPKLKEDYERAICAYSLVKNNQNAADTILEQLESSPNKVVEGNSKHWKTPSNTLDIETTAYALLTYSVKDDRVNGLLILKWLVLQRNAFGGFSVQDTIVGLHALTEFARLIYSKVVDLTLAIKSKTGGVEKVESTLTLNSANHDVLQFVNIPSAVDEIIIQANGSGLALVDIIQFYNLKGDERAPSFVIELTTRNETTRSFTLNMCASSNVFIHANTTVIYEIGMISGFEPEMEKVDVPDLLKKKQFVKGRLILYFTGVTKTAVCVDVPVSRVSVVVGVRPATCVVYSLSDLDTVAIKQYLPKNMQGAGLCSVCPECCDQDMVPLTDCGVAA
ncbi:CD109 antigen-like [Dreissena polymorpha]|uniref:CD109 antigen-like n=1 Tax=Dreissena polymorpha TaxID=45954 RepID=UPI002264EF99|nr:CD109 antigen-like [Dreissena polymorpha]